jgi:hypothetical protein
MVRFFGDLFPVLSIALSKVSTNFCSFQASLRSWPRLGRPKDQGRHLSFFANELDEITGLFKAQLSANCLHLHGSVGQQSLGFQNQALVDCRFGGHASGGQTNSAQGLVVHAQSKGAVRGFLGVSGVSGVSGERTDLRTLRACSSDAALFAAELFSHRVVRELGHSAPASVASMCWSLPAALANTIPCCANKRASPWHNSACR